MTTIRRQLTWKLLVAFVAPLLIAGAMAFALIRDEMVEQFDDALEAQATAVAAVTRIQADGTVDVAASSRVARDFGAHEAVEDDQQSPPAFQIRRLDGSSVLRSTSLGSADLPAPAEPRDQPQFWNVVLRSGDPGRAVAFTFRPEPVAAGKVAGERPLVLVAAVDRRELDRTVRWVALLLAGCGSVVFIATFLVVPRVIRREFIPIDALADQAGRITADSLGTRFSTGALPGELEPIGRRLNDLLGRLETSFDRERRFSADLAHELRTPLAELRSLAELAVKWPDARAADTDRDVIAIATQMESIVTRLLAMVRSEHDGMPIAFERVELDAVLQSAWQPLAARATERDVHVAWHMPASSAVSADPVLLRSIVSNLLQNAVDYSPAGGALTVEARATEGGFELEVRNPAPGLSADDATKLFDRFWRHDTARSGGDHAGLGLSLARSFARAMGGDLTATLEGEALTLTLTSTNNFDN